MIVEQYLEGVSLDNYFSWWDYVIKRYLNTNLYLIVIS